ncbi:hypothetical protein [Octadecabacter sp. R77987]|uniref:hypothetical protein n=1 Tax=Octadecabacter sp. R77987 TaxID=3093874 RepID=UPI00366E0AFD
MKTFVTAACAATLALTTTFAAFAETRTEPGEWRPDNADILENRYGCDPDEWTRAVSDIDGETLYTNNWTCDPGRATPRGSRPCINIKFLGIESTKATAKCFYGNIQSVE